MAKRPCAVERVYEAMMPDDRKMLKIMIEEPDYTAGMIAEALQSVGFQVDRMQVGHFRRKLRAGKATL